MILKYIAVFEINGAHPACTMWLSGAHILIYVHPVCVPYFKLFLYINHHIRLNTVKIHRMHDLGFRCVRTINVKF